MSPQERGVECFIACASYSREREEDFDGEETKNGGERGKVPVTVSTKKASGGPE